MRVPSPAASTMVRLVLPVILIRNVSRRGCAAAVIKGFQPERKRFASGKAAKPKTLRGFLIMFGR